MVILDIPVARPHLTAVVRGRQRRTRVARLSTTVLAQATGMNPAGGNMKSVIAAACLLLAGIAASRAETAAEFYRNRQLTMLIGTTAGGGYDIFGRMFARYMGKYLPGGRARFVVQNMPGAGRPAPPPPPPERGGRAGPRIPPGGRAAIFEPLLAADGQARFDPRRFLWLG